MLKLITGCVVVLLMLSGCDETINDQKFFRLTLLRGANVWCDKETNIEYLIYKSLSGGGMSVRYNKDGDIKHCPKQLKGK